MIWWQTKLLLSLMLHGRGLPRTTPIVVSVFDDAYSTVLTLECDHRFGMDVVGDPSSVWAFRYACSSAINPIEHWVMETLFPGGNHNSITVALGQMGEMVDVFISNGYQVMMSSIEDLYLVLDLETGIVRDVMITYITMSGAYCFSDLQTEWASELCEDLLNNQSGLFDSIGDLSVYLGAIVGTTVTATLEGLSLTGMAMFGIASAFILGPFVFLEHMIEQAEREGNFNTATWYKQNFLDRWIDIGYFILFQSGGWADALNEQNAYINMINQPLYEQRDREWKQFYDNLWKVLSLTAEDEELEDGQTTLDDFKFQQLLNEGLACGQLPDGSDGDPDEWAEAIKNTLRIIKKQFINMYNGIKTGNAVEIAKGAAGTGIGIFILSVLARGLSYDLIEESYQNYMQFWEDDSGSSGGGGGGVIP